MELMSIAQSRASLLSSNFAESLVRHQQPVFIRRLTFGSPNSGREMAENAPQINTVSWSRVDCGVGYRKER